MKAKLLFFSIIMSFSIPLVGMYSAYSWSSRHTPPSRPSYKDTSEYCLKEVRIKIDKNCKLADIEKFVKRKKFGNALTFVIRRDAPDLCEKLLAMDADPNDSKNKKGQPIRKAMACRTRSRIVELLLQYGVSITEKSPRGNTLLIHTVFHKGRNRVRHRSTENGATFERLHHLLAHKDSMKLINCKDREGNTALGWAVIDLEDRMSGNLDTKEAIAIVDLLLAHGENPDLVTHSQIALRLSLFQRIKAYRQIEKSDYAPFLRYIPKRHQQFKNDCADRLAKYLVQLLPLSDNNLPHVPLEDIQKIANKCWDCDED